MKQLILHIPHSSSNIPLKEGYIVDNEFLNAEMLKLTDWYTDDLFQSDDEISVVADFSRIFCDPERFAEDDKEVMAQFGMGVLYEKSDDGKVIRQLTPELRERILQNYYWKHHRLLTEAVKNQLNKNGKAIIIDCHSFPSVPLECSLNKEPNRPDFNIGTDKFHTSQNLIDVSENFFKQKGFSLGVDWPYQGTIVPMDYYNKNKNVQSIMLEINRKLYLKEPSNIKSESYREIKNVVKQFIKTINDCI